MGISLTNMYWFKLDLTVSTKGLGITVQPG